AERVVRELEQAGPPALFAAAAGKHAAPQLDLPARDREQRGIFLLPLAAPPAHLLRVELRRHVQGHVGRGTEDLLEAPGPHAVQLDHALVAGPPHRPSWPSTRKL